MDLIEKLVLSSNSISTVPQRRQTKFTPERLSQIANLVERGKSREEIAALIGVTVGTLRSPAQNSGSAYEDPGSTPDRAICDQPQSAPAWNSRARSGSRIPVKWRAAPLNRLLQPPP